jgi:predicted transcriptional regulator
VNACSDRGRPVCRMVEVWYRYGMAAVKSTYSLDHNTLKKLRQLARSWQVSKTEVVRRAISAAAERELPIPSEKRMAAIDALRKSMRGRGVDFERWKREIRRGRR